MNNNTKRVVLNPKDNGGEAIVLGVEILDEAQPVFIETQCYGTHANRLLLSGITLDDLQRAITELKSEVAVAEMTNAAIANARK